MRQYPFSSIQSGEMIQFTYNGGTHGDMTRVCYVFEAFVGQIACFDFTVGANRTFKLEKITGLIKLNSDRYTKIRYNTEAEKNDYQIAFFKHGGRCAVDYDEKIIVILLPEKFSVNGELVIHNGGKHIVIQDGLVLINGESRNYSTLAGLKEIVAKL